jgi:hypothetical protein
VLERCGSMQARDHAAPGDASQQERGGHRGVFVVEAHIDASGAVGQRIVLGERSCAPATHRVDAPGSIGYGGGSPRTRTVRR